MTTSAPTRLLAFGFKEPHHEDNRSNGPCVAIVPVYRPIGPSEGARAPAPSSSSPDFTLRRRSVALAGALYDKLELVGHSGQVGQRGGLHLSHDLTPVNLHGDFADSQFARNLLVKPTGDNLGHHLPLPRGQCFKTRSQNRHRLLVIETSPVARQANLDCIEEILISEGLGQELDRAALHCLNRHGNVAMARNEDDRKIDAARNQLALQIKPALSGKSNVKHEAGRTAWPAQLMEFIHRSQHSHLKADRSDEAADGLSHSRIVIDDNHGRLTGRRRRHTLWASAL